MGPWKPRAPLPATALATLLSVCLVATGWAASKDPVPAAVGGLSIASDPDGAAVDIDGRPAGATPVEIARIVAGAHRVRLVKSGYLENSRIVTVAAGPTTRVSVKLTQTSGTPQTAPQSTSAGHTWTRNKWLWIGAAGGGALAATLILTKNDPPTAGSILVTPAGTGMAGQTSFTLRSTGARDPDGDSLSFAWNFGDGGSGTGESVTHTYTTAGAFQVTLTVSDGKHTVTAPNATVTVGPSLSGNWTGGSILMPDATGRVVVNCGLTLALSQNGTTLTGTMLFAGACLGNPALASGSATVLIHPTSVSVASVPFQFLVTQGLVIRFIGTTNAAGTTLSGNITLSQPSSGFVQTTATSFTKQ